MKTTVLVIIAALPLAATDYHLDCAGGNDTAPGTSPATAWRSPARASQQTFRPGDRLLVKRGTTCAGPLTPKGSGAPDQPAIVTAYGEGARPRILAPGAPAAFALFNQSYWRIENLELGGSTEYGIHVSGDTGVMHNIELRDLTIRDVHGPLKKKNSGLVVVEARKNALFENLVIDGILAERTSQWAGIIVNGAGLREPLADRRSRNVTIRNSVVNDVWGDGIVLYQVEQGLIERSAAWHTGMEVRQTIGTPNGIWTWRCADCVVRECESFWSDSPGVDGGAFDIDWGNDRNIVEDSYGHDSLAYCIAVFGAGKRVTTQSVIRNNVCAGNGRSPRLARHHGEVHLYTWNGGKIDGVLIENNIIEWSPPFAGPAIKDEADWATAQRAIVRNNIIRPAPTTAPPWQSGTLVISRDNSHDGRGLRVIAASARAQFTARGLKVVEAEGPPQVSLRGPNGRVEKEWKGYVPAKEVLWLIRQSMGEPRPANQT
jgi:hypothetical protein